MNLIRLKMFSKWLFLLLTAATMVLIIIYDSGMISLQQQVARKRNKNKTKQNEKMFGLKQLRNVLRATEAQRMKSHMQWKTSEEMHKKGTVRPTLILHSFIRKEQNKLHDNDSLESRPKVALPSLVGKVQGVFHDNGKLESRPKVAFPSVVGKVQGVFHDNDRLESWPKVAFPSQIGKVQDVFHNDDRVESSKVIAGLQGKIKVPNRPHRIGARRRLSSEERKEMANGKHSKHDIQFHRENRPKFYQQCPNWKINRQDWTLVYHGSMKKYNSNCPKPHIGSNTKRVSFDDGSYINTGCTNRTYECKERPFYDFKAGQRINTPPCCRHHVIQMLEHVTKELKRQEIKHSMISGGVIGWVRDKKMVPYDRDLDIILEQDFWNTTEFWNMFQKLNERYGYDYDLVEDFKLKLYFSKINRISLDIWAYLIKNDTLAIAYHGFKSQKVQIMLPFQYVQFEWFDTYVPNKPREYLNRQYGRERWTIEKLCMVKDAEGDCW
eukprot:Seg6987.2 transcript_id=Seg6987.2/GoldUCD/mRNA.D3Y31 product="Fukutin-related protein" protein_id=Seg6987.2/GoldUCD/D3Y31